jgi:Cu+-exporting ATPase
MWPFKKKVQGDSLRLKISGMHCSTCAINIDNAIENIDGVVSSKTNFAKGKVEVIYQPGRTVQSEAKKAIEKLGYKLTS